VVAGDQHVEVVLDDREDLFAVTAASDAVTEERAHVRAARVIEARAKRSYVAVRSTERCECLRSHAGRIPKNLCHVGRGCLVTCS